ncbi:hypothetical protein [Clostridium baratii]|uniref:hypothetical protein n=1 Tax=Clostridium baratii TaxID=1561 RepID=UPI0030CD28A6
MVDKGVFDEGFTQVENKLIKHKELDCIEKMMLINFMSYGENVYPSITRICEELNISRPTCVKKINRLKEIGYLKVTKNKSLNGDYDNNSYEVVKKFNYVVNEINHGSKNNLPQVVKEFNSNNTNKTILNNNIYSAKNKNDEDSEMYMQKIDDIWDRLNNKYDYELIQREKKKLIDKDLKGLDLLIELERQLEKHNKKTDKNNLDKEVEEIWKLYPLKKGKANAIKKIPSLLKKYGKEQLKRCIERYVKDVEYQRANKFRDLNYKNGSTFFNGGYVDYLDCNYEEVKAKEVKKAYDLDELL